MTCAHPGLLAGGGCLWPARGRSRLPARRVAGRGPCRPAGSEARPRADRGYHAAAGAARRRAQRQRRHARLLARGHGDSVIAPAMRGDNAGAGPGGRRARPCAIAGRPGRARGAAAVLAHRERDFRYRARRVLLLEVGRKGGGGRRGDEVEIVHVLRIESGADRGQALTGDGPGRRPSSGRCCTRIRLRSSRVSRGAPADRVLDGSGPPARHPGAGDSRTPRRSGHLDASTASLSMIAARVSARGAQLWPVSARMGGASCPQRSAILPRMCLGVIAHALVGIGNR